MLRVQKSKNLTGLNICLDTLKVSKKVAGVEYAIRDIVLAARKVQQKGMKVDYLNIGDPVQFGFQPPDNVKQALIDAVKNGNNFYSSSEGLPELREEIAKKENAKGLSITGDDILVTNGVSEALDMVISSIVEEGDEVRRRPGGERAGEPQAPAPPALVLPDKPPQPRRTRARPRRHRRRPLLAAAPRIEQPHQRRLRIRATR